MKVLLICPSNMYCMPYVNTYLEALEKSQVQYDLINWDRMHTEDCKWFCSYRDSKIELRRNFFDYYRYAKFISKKIKNNNYGKIVVFGLQLSFFLRNLLLKHYKERFIIDIRDYNRILKHFSFTKLIQASASTVLSSKAFKEWLPESDKYVINHNTKIKSISELKKPTFRSSRSLINIACIGLIRDYAVNIELINVLKNSAKINLAFHGEGAVCGKLQEYIEIHNIENVKTSGRYEHLEEGILYDSADMLNILIENEGLNNLTLLPNRLYNALLYGKPIIALEGTYLADIVDSHNLGLVINSFDNLEIRVRQYINDFDIQKYLSGRQNFLRTVFAENAFFYRVFSHFIGKNLRI